MPKAKAMTESKAADAICAAELRAYAAYDNIDWQEAVAVQAILKACTAQFPDLQTISVEMATDWIERLRLKIEAYTSGATEFLELNATPRFTRISEFVMACWEAERITYDDYCLFSYIANQAFENGLDVDRKRFWEESPDRMLCGTLDCYLDAPAFYGFEVPSDALRAVLQEVL